MSSSINCSVQRFNEYNCITIDPLEISDTRIPCEIALVIDTSGSMDSKITSSTGEVSNLSILDIVKHTCKAIIGSLDENDLLTIITYSNSAIIELSLTNMTSVNKIRSLQILDNITAHGMTNIYDGLKKAYNILQNDNINNKCILLLSDGVPNIEPPLGTAKQFKKDIEETINKCPIINTFGFGYSVDSKVLKDIANIGNGTFGFIPDGNFVGTVIINSLANTLCTFHKNALLSLIIDGDYEVLGITNYLSTSWGINIPLGALRLGQSRHIIIKSNNPINEISLTFETIIDESHTTINCSEEVVNEDFIMLHIFRCKLITLIDDLILLINQNKHEEARVILNNLINNIKEYLETRDILQMNSLLQMNGLLQDLEGQITQAINENYFKKWGEKYLPSLQNAHLLEECNNFKDCGVQFYVSTLFKTLQNIIEEYFLTLPPPTAKVTRSSYSPSPLYSSGPSYSYSTSYSPSQSTYYSPSTSIPTNMASFYNRDSACIHGLCVVAMKNGHQKLVQDIIKGDEVLGGTVELVVRTKCINNKMLYYQSPSGLLITGYHPIKYNNNYVFPCNIFEGNIYDSDYMYSFLLKNKNGKRPPTIIINNYECLALAHNITNDPVAQHDFFGTEKIVDDLKRCNNWESGQVTFYAGTNIFSRNIDGKVTGLNIYYDECIESTINIV